MSTTPPAATQTLDLHLRVVGAILESHEALYRAPREQATKQLVYRVLSELRGEAVSAERIREILCYYDVPLVTLTATKRALQALEAEAHVRCDTRSRPRLYALTGDIRDCVDTLSLDIESAWDRHFSTCLGLTSSDFRVGLAKVFAHYGCSAFPRDRAQKLDFAKATAHVADHLVDEYRECFGDFVLSQHPDDARLKLRLASAYAFLRMNGAANADALTLKHQFANKRLLLDTNVLFEIVGRSHGQVRLLMDRLRDLGAVVLVGTETLKEFEFALRTQASQVALLLKNHAPISDLVDAHLVRSDWLRALLEDHSSDVTRARVEERVQRLIDQAEGLLDEMGVRRVHLDRESDARIVDERVHEVQSAATRIRPYPKNDQVARHDALLWGALADDPTLADHIVTRDVSLRLLTGSGEEPVIMLDEIVAVTVLGGATSDDMAAIFSHIVSRNLIPDIGFLSLDDITTISNMEVNLLTGPPRALRRAAVTLSKIRFERLARGQTVDDGEVGRIVMNAISSCQDDRIAAEQALGLAAAEGTKRAEAEARASSAENERRALEVERDRFSASASRIPQLEADVANLNSRNVATSSEAERAKQEKLNAEAGRASAEKTATAQRDWIQFCIACVVVGAVLYFVGLTWPGSLAVIAAVSCLAWLGLRHQVPPISAKALGRVLAIAGGILALAEKRDVLTQFLARSQDALVPVASPPRADERPPGDGDVDAGSP